MKLKLSNFVSLKKRTSRCVAPKDSYDAIIIGSSVHALAGAYSLANDHGITNIAVIAEGDFEPRTGFIQANYNFENHHDFYAHAAALWQDAPRRLGGHIKGDGLLDLCHSAAQFDVLARRGNVIRAQGGDALLCDLEMVQDLVPILNCEDARSPIYGGLYQKNVGVRRHETVYLRYLRALDKLGVDCISNCQINAMIIENGQIYGLETSVGCISTKKLAITEGAENLHAPTGIEIPILRQNVHVFETHAHARLLKHVVTYGNDKVQIKQSRQGQIRISACVDEGAEMQENLGHIMRVALEMLPALEAATIVRAGREVVEYTEDGLPMISKTSVNGLYVNLGWLQSDVSLTSASGKALAQLLLEGEVGSILPYNRNEVGA